MKFFVIVSRLHLFYLVKVACEQASSRQMPVDVGISFASFWSVEPKKSSASVPTLTILLLHASVWLKLKVSRDSSVDPLFFVIALSRKLQCGLGLPTPSSFLSTFKNGLFLSKNFVLANRFLLFVCCTLRQATQTCLHTSRLR